MADETTPWLTIITVVKDDPGGFERTAISIRQQDRTGVEWLVVDSSSEAVSAPDASYRWSPPSGIYPAMNEGLAHARGKYVYFLNAGDSLTDPSVLSELRPMLLNRNPVWLVGEVAFVDEIGTPVVPPPLNYAAERKALFSRGRFPPHQGTIAQREALSSGGGFNLEYAIAADYEAMLRLALLGDPVTTDLVLANFAVGGTSSVQWRQAVGEFHRARRTVFRPTGTTAIMERTNTLQQVVAMSAARVLGRTGR